MDKFCLIVLVIPPVVERKLKAHSATNVAKKVLVNVLAPFLTRGVLCSRFIFLRGNRDITVFIL